MNLSEANWSELSDIVELLTAHADGVLDKGQHYTIGNLYCPRCSDVRRTTAKCVVSPFSDPFRASTAPRIATVSRLRQIGIAALVPSLFQLQCVQCSTGFTAVIFKGPDGPSLAVLPSSHGGVTTAHTAAPVKYYLDQAHRSQSVGGYSAAVAMYRAALEQLLFDQGYKKGMLADKIKQLESDVKAGTAPRWALDLDSAFLKVIKDLGNAAIHPNQGNIKKQAALDTKLIARVQAMFLYVLKLVYERDAEAKGHLAALRKVATRMQPKKPAKAAAAVLTTETSLASAPPSGPPPKPPRPAL